MKIGNDHYLILLACNEFLEVMDSVVANKEYHEECRKTLKYTKTMTLEPAWFRVGLHRMPKEFIADLQEDDAQKDQLVPSKTSQ